MRSVIVILILLWLESYLSDRQQRVVIPNHCSSWAKVTSSVPCGCPLFFVFYINDTVDYVKNVHVLLYADDMKLLKEISSLANCRELQSDLNEVSEWISKWKLNLSNKKCSTMTFSSKTKGIFYYEYKLNNLPLCKVDKVKDLGVTFKANLSFCAHYSDISARASKMLGFIKCKTKDLKT